MFIKRRWLILGLLCSIGVAIVTTVVLRLNPKTKLTMAKDFLAKGFPHLAMEALDEVRTHFVNSEDGCKTLLAVYRLAENTERVAWAIDACRFSKVQLVDLDLASAWLNQLRNKPSEVLAALKHAIVTFPNDSVPYAFAATVLAEQKNYLEAVNLLKIASQKFPKQPLFRLNLVDAQLRSNDRAGAEKTATELRLLPDLPAEATAHLNKLLSRASPRD